MKNDNKRIKETSKELKEFIFILTVSHYLYY